MKVVYLIKVILQSYTYVNIPATGETSVNINIAVFKTEPAAIAITHHSLKL